MPRSGWSSTRREEHERTRPPPPREGVSEVTACADAERILAEGVVERGGGARVVAPEGRRLPRDERLAEEGLLEGEVLELELARSVAITRENLDDGDGATRHLLEEEGELVGVGAERTPRVVQLEGAPLGEVIRGRDVPQHPARHALAPRARLMQHYMANE